MFIRIHTHGHTHTHTLFIDIVKGFGVNPREACSYVSATSSAKALRPLHSYPRARILNIGGSIIRIWFLRIPLKGSFKGYRGLRP